MIGLRVRCMHIQIAWSESAASPMRDYALADANA